MAETGQEPTVIWRPQQKQSLFITCPCDDVAFGGARGGGKSDAVAGDFIAHENQYAEHAIAMAFRRERTQIVELIERCKQIMLPLGYKWKEQDKLFLGPKGGRLRFTYLERDADADAYQGHSYTRLYPEEMGTFPNEAPVNKLQATLRSGQGVPCQMKGTMNPGGSGHQWVKERYRIGEFPEGSEVFKFEFVNPFTKKRIEKTRVFIKSLVTDNAFLGDDYIANLFQVGSEALVRAWLEGDWNAVEGAFFDTWRTERHVVDPARLPDHWLRFRSMDWGFARPFSVGWWAIASEDYDLGLPWLIPKGAMIRYREWYGSKGPNEGVRLTADEVAEGIKDREQDETIAYGVLDPSAFSQDGGPSHAERMADHGVLFKRADNQRVSRLGALGGWDTMRARIKGLDGVPMIYWFSTCRDSIRTIPVLQHDRDRPEDLDTDAEDHCFTADTLVATDKGPTAIVDLVPGKHRVWAGNAWRSHWSSRMTRANAETLKLTFDDGSTVNCTPDHKFVEVTGEMRYARDLLGSKVAWQNVPQSHGRASIGIGAAATISAKVSACIERFGIIITGQYQKAHTSIIRMETRPITTFPTWNASPFKSILASVTTLVSAASRALQWLRRPPASGTAARLAASGTASITSVTYGTLPSDKLPRLVRCAASNTWLGQFTRPDQNTVTLTVEPKLCVRVEGRPRANVYCLDEPETRTFALGNGVIVSNCADETRYACMSRPWVAKPPRSTEVDLSKPRLMTIEDFQAAERRRGSMPQRI